MSNGLHGFRDVKSWPNVTSIDLDKHGSFSYIEVTNPGNTNANIHVNDFPEQGHPASGPIPVLAGQTRPIPMTVYNLTSDQPVTVVAYHV